MCPLDEERYAERMSGHRARWEARAAETSDPRHHRATVHQYAVHRARTLRRPYHERLTRCSKVGVRIRCGCTGWRGVRWFGCRQHLTCETCRAQRAKRLGRRVREALEVALAGAAAGSKLVLLTLTLRHSGDVAADRAALASGWRRLYKRMNAEYGRYPYIGVWEYTAGRDGLGHVHAHVAVVWPWRDWGEIREWWLAACPESERITFVARRRDGKASDARSVSNYLAKYMAKGVELCEMTPQLRADIVAAAYNQRSVFTSHRFWQPWVPVCKRCGQPHELAQYRWHGAPFEPPDPLAVPPDPQLELGLPLQRAGPWHP